MELLEHIKINNFIIDLINGKQPLYQLINGLELVKLETLKTYIKINLVNSFIMSFEFLSDPLILFFPKSNGNLYLCVNYQDLNNLTIKNWYLLSLIDESLNWLGRTKQFFQLNLTNAYHWIRICREDK